MCGREASEHKSASLDGDLTVISTAELDFSIGTVRRASLGDVGVVSI